jgi:hypothetical protein
MYGVVLGHAVSILDIRDVVYADANRFRAVREYAAVLNSNIVTAGTCLKT